MPQVITTEQVTSVEINFYEHEIYCGQKLIARISYDHNDFVTQPWVVLVNGEEIFRAIAYMKCYDFVTWHYKQGTLPVQQEETPATSTGNEMMVRVAEACECVGLELLEDGIYYRDKRIVEFVYSNGQCYYVQTSKEQPLAEYESVDLLDVPIGQLTPEQREMLFWGEGELAA